MALQLLARALVAALLLPQTTGALRNAAEHRQESAVEANGDHAEAHLQQIGTVRPAAHRFSNWLSTSRKHREVPFRRDGFLTITTQDGRQVSSELEVPKDVKSFMQGLMYRSSICEKCSMIFSWREDGDRPFWMKDTWIPLDLVWVNHDKVIVDIKQAKANDETSVSNDSPAQYVFEFREGWCQDHGVKVGDAISWKHESSLPIFEA
uniref:DUF192 domain-containing protein n=1 Tax=Alexandrium andersonii TaxID=327968 RepID=A0A7S2AGN0_9DINO|mmetsp:Transcript_11926/g.27031  ORF Transcript_11926/g.27031 Transcript_11926/m.27031 type:complete len:207 (+) Transcript_11926:86-706(+)